MANTYISITQMCAHFDERILAQLTNDRNSTQVDTVKLQIILDSVANLFDSYVAGRIEVTVPLPAVPLIVTRWCAIKAIEMLYIRRANKPRAIREQIEWADKWMDDLISRRVSLPPVGNVSFPMEEPSLTSAGQTDGTSQFDNLPYGLGKSLPSPTGTSKGKVVQNPASST